MGTNGLHAEIEIGSQVSGLNSEIRDFGGIEHTIFESQPHVSDSKSGIPETSARPASLPVRAPEKKLTLLALRLATLEKAASGIGALAFIWATVVLLGGFAITLGKSDFWFITLILLSESTRIFGRSHELEWQQHSTRLISDLGINSYHAIVSTSSFVMKRFKSVFWRAETTRKSKKRGKLSGNRDQASRKNWSTQRMPTRTWTSSEVPFFPYAKRVFISKNISCFLYCIQLASAVACLVLSVIKLALRNYGEQDQGSSDGRNRDSALTLFYSLALAEALLFLLEKAYWEWKFSVERLLEAVNKECEMEDSGLDSVRRFFYDAYSKCINGSVFDGLKMDLVSFATELIASKSPDEQLMGIRILRTFTMNPRFSEYTHEMMGTNIAVMERLVEMLSWTDSEEQEIRHSAAEILSELAGRKQNSQRIAEIPGAMVSISCLLHTQSCGSGACYHISKETIPNGNFSSWEELNKIGMKILKKLAHDQGICEKIGNVKGLLPKIVDFMCAEERLLRHPSPPPYEISISEQALQVVKMLASNSGASGKQLRKHILQIVFTFSYIRDILRYGARYPELQILATEILTNLAIEGEATERIHNTGGILEELFNIFFNYEVTGEQGHVRVAVGKALSVLTLNSKDICERILKLTLNEKLVKALEIPFLRISAARILRNICTFSGKSFLEFQELTASTPTVLEGVISEDVKLQEAMMGAASRIFKLLPYEASKTILNEAGMKEMDLASQAFSILQKFESPSTKVPNIRRYAIELSIWLMRDNKAFIGAFIAMGMKKQLELVLGTTSELESFSMFCGTVGVCRHSMNMRSLVEMAIKLLQEDINY